MKKQYIQPMTFTAVSVPQSLMLGSTTKRDYEIGNKDQGGISGGATNYDGSDDVIQRAKGNAWTTWEED